eukprot:167880-Chlamydomonas_euryale.AAC.1
MRFPAWYVRDTWCPCAMSCAIGGVTVSACAIAFSSGSSQRAGTPRICRAATSASCRSYAPAGTNKLCGMYICVTEESVGRGESPRACSCLAAAQTTQASASCTPVKIAGSAGSETRSATQKTLPPLPRTLPEGGFHPPRRAPLPPPRCVAMLGALPRALPPAAFACCSHPPVQARTHPMF